LVATVQRVWPRAYNVRETIHRTLPFFVKRIST
jgi:hypothetical protein